MVNLISIAALFLSRAFGRTLFAAAARSKSYATAAAGGGKEGHNPLQEFLEADRCPDDDKPVVYCRSWKASELRLKSWDDLHKLCYVLLKENILVTQRQMLNAQNLRFPNPERIPKKVA